MPALAPLASGGLVLFMTGPGTTRFRWRGMADLVGDLLFVAAFALPAWKRGALRPSWARPTEPSALFAAPICGSSQMRV